jgi:hypothetical protein
MGFKTNGLQARAVKRLALKKVSDFPRHPQRVG